MCALHRGGTLTLDPEPCPAEGYRYPGFPWLTGHPALDALLTLWRREQRWNERRPPRYSEIAPHLLIPGCAGFVLARDRGGMRSPQCFGMFPAAAGLLGLPENFAGTDWRDQERRRPVAALIRKATRSGMAVRGTVSPGPLTCRPDGVLVAVGVPLAPEPGNGEGNGVGNGVGNGAVREKPVILAVSWPLRERKPWGEVSGFADVPA